MMRVHSLGKINLVIGGVPISGGFPSDGDCVTAEYDEDAWTVQTGVDGEACADENLNKSGKITLRQMGSSGNNALLSAMFYAQKAAKIPLPIFMNDGLGTSLVEVPTAMIQKMPAWVEGKTSSPVNWVFLVSDMYLFLGGNFKQGIA